MFKLFKKIKYIIRILAIKFYDKTEYYVVPRDLFERISRNNKNKKELRKIQEEIKELKSLYPYERTFLKAEAVIERMLILER